MRQYDGQHVSPSPTKLVMSTLGRRQVKIATIARDLTLGSFHKASSRTRPHRVYDLICLILQYSLGTYEVLDKQLLSHVHGKCRI
jgi:hypothetical protein